MNTTARWDGNRLMISWYGGREGFGGAWDDVKNVFIFEGNDDVLRFTRPEKPSAEECLALINRWQEAG